MIYVVLYSDKKVRNELIIYGGAIVNKEADSKEDE